MTEKIIVECPSCQVRFFVTNELLGIANGALRCGFCQQIFNGLESIVEEAAPTPAPPEFTPSVAASVKGLQECGSVRAEEYRAEPEPPIAIKEELVKEEFAVSEVASIKKVFDADYSDDYWREVANAFSDISKMGAAELEQSVIETVTVEKVDDESLKMAQPLNVIDDDILDYLETVDFDSLLQDKDEPNKKPKAQASLKEEEVSSASVAIQRLRASMKEPAFTPNSLESLAGKLQRTTQESKSVISLEEVQDEAVSGSVSSVLEDDDLSGAYLSQSEPISNDVAEADPFHVLLEEPNLTPAKNRSGNAESFLRKPSSSGVISSVVEKDSFSTFLQTPESASVVAPVGDKVLLIPEQESPISKPSSLDLKAKPLHIEPSSYNQPSQFATPKSTMSKPSSLGIDVRSLHIPPLSSEQQEAKTTSNSPSRPKPVLTLVEKTPLAHKESVTELKAKPLSNAEPITTGELQILEGSLQGKLPLSGTTEVAKTSNSERTENVAVKTSAQKPKPLSKPSFIEDFLVVEKDFGNKQKPEFKKEFVENFVDNKEPEYVVRAKHYHTGGAAKDIYGNQLRVVADIDFDIPSKKIMNKSTVLWALLSVVAMLLLGAQYLRYSAPHWANNPAKRAIAESICGVLQCKIAPFIDTSSIKSGKDKLVVRSNSQYVGVLDVDALIYNNAAFVQPYPAIELRFTNYNGQVVASRVFAPNEYLNAETLRENQMPKAVPIRISLQIADPTEQAVGYELHFYPANVAAR